MNVEKAIELVDKEAETLKKILDTKALKYEVDEKIASIEARVLREISNDDTLTNDLKRKAKQMTMLVEDAEYTSLRNKAKELEFVIERLSIEAKKLSKLWKTVIYMTGLRPDDD